MRLLDEVRAHCREVASSARFVSIDLDAWREPEAVPADALDPESHYLEGPAEDVAAYLLTLDAINFGSGWFPTLDKRPGCSGYYTVAWALADRFRTEGPWNNEELRSLHPAAVADALVPHVLRVDGVLHYDDALARRIDAGELLEPGGAEREIRAAAVHACELIAAELGI